MLALLLVAACGSNGEKSDVANATVVKAATYDGPDRQEVLAKGAQKEAKLFIYTSMGLKDFNGFIKGFNEKYPDIQVDVYSATGEKVIQRALTEYQSGRHATDVVLVPSTDVGHFAKAGNLQDYTSPNTPDGVDQDALGGVPVYINRFVLAWNTKQVKSADAPTSYEELLDPKWKGKVGLEAGDVPWMATLYGVWGKEKATSYFEKLAGQKPFVQDGHTTLAELVASGEVPLSPNVYDYDAESLKKSGAPIEWAPLDPLVVYPYVVSLPKAAPHPNASMLFIDYMLSKEGQQGIADLGRTPASPDIPPTQEGLRAIQKLPTTALDPLKWSDGLKEFNDLWQSTIRN